MSTLKANKYQHVDRTSPSIEINDDGSVSIASTVTYEDVTSVDSVGMVTARTGLRATAGGLVVTAGVSTFTGAIDANSTSTFGDDVTFEGASYSVAWDKSQNSLEFADNTRLTVGAGRDYQLYHDGTYTWALDNSSGGLHQKANKFVWQAYDDATNMAIFHEDGACRFYFDGTERLSTTNSGITIYDNLNVAGVSTFVGNVSIADKIIHTGDTDTALRFPAADTFTVETAGTEKLRITSDGKFGFNDSAPERTIDVKGSNCMIQLEGTGGNGRQYSLCSTDDTTGSGVDGGPSGTFAIYDDTAGSARLRIDSSGRIGVNASPGGYGQFVTSGIGTVISANASSGAVSIGLYEGGTGRFFLKSLSGADGLAFVDGDDSSERARITADGSLLVGATAVEDWDGSRAHRIQVRGNTYQTAGISILDTQNDDNPCELLLGKSRGTGNTIVQSADDVGQIRWSANDGNGFHSIAYIRGSMNGAPGSDSLPSKLTFGTCTDNTVTVSDRLIINNRGSIENQTMSQANANSWTASSAQSFMRTSPRSIQFTLNKTWSIASDGMKSGIIFKLDGSNGDNVTITVEGSFNWTSSATAGGYYKAKWTMNQQYNGVTWRLIEQTNSHPYNCGITAVQNGVDAGTTHIGWFSGSTSGSAGFEIKYPVITIEGEGYDSVSYKVEDKNDTLTKKFGRRNDNDQAHVWEIEGSERERIVSGNHYFGTTADVSTSQRGVKISNLTTGNPVLVETSSAHYTGGNYSHYVFYTDTNQCGAINCDNNTTTYATSSDYRLKENQVSISDGITRVKQLKPYKFNFKNEPDRTLDGFFAHEVQSVVPIAVSGTKDEMKSFYYEEEDTIPDGKEVGDFKEFSTTEINPQSIDHSKLIPLLTAALQEAITKIETLEAKVAALESA